MNFSLNGRSCLSLLIQIKLSNWLKSLFEFSHCNQAFCMIKYLIWIFHSCRVFDSIRFFILILLFKSTFLLSESFLSGFLVQVELFEWWHPYLSFTIEVKLFRNDDFHLSFFTYIYVFFWQKSALYSILIEYFALWNFPFTFSHSSRAFVGRKSSFVFFHSSWRWAFAWWKFSVEFSYSIQAFFELNA